MLAVAISIDQNANVLTDSGRFLLEKDLVSTLSAASIVNALDLMNRWHQMVPEVTVRERTADLVLLHANERPEGKPARVSYFEAAIVAQLLQHGESALSEIADKLYATAISIESRAFRLARLGLVDRQGDRLRPTGRHVPGDVRVIAIEAKLTRWRDAVAQAVEYRSFANQAYIAMPSAVFERSPDVLPACASVGVGALGVAIDGSVTMLLKADEAGPQSPEWVRLLSSVVGVAHTSSALNQTA